MESSVDVVVVGGGIAGLAAALQAARLGSSVCLLDAHDLGGRARSDERRGFTFNRGPHALYDRGAGRAALASLGVPVTGAKAPLTGARGLRDGALHVLPTSPWSLLTSDLVSPAGRVALARVLLSLPRAVTPDLVAASAREWITGATRRPDVAAVVEALVRLSTYSADPDSLSADAAVAQLRLSTGGVSYLDGGWQSIVDGLATAARAAGVEVRTGDAADGLEPGPESVAVTTGAGPVDARAVVVAAGGPADVGRLLPGMVPDDLGPPVTATCVDYGLAAPPPVRFVLGIDDPVYLSQHAPDARLAPPGKSVVCALRYRAGGRDAAEGLDRLLALAGVEPDAVEERRVLASMTVAHTQPRPGSGLDGRPGVRVPGSDRCFLAGDWVGDTGLLGDAALASGVAAGALAARR